MHNIKTQFTSFLLTILTVLTLFPAVPAMAAEVEEKSTSNTTLYSGQYTGGWDQVSSTTTVTDANGRRMMYIRYLSGGTYRYGYLYY